MNIHDMLGITPKAPPKVQIVIPDVPAGVTPKPQPAVPPGYIMVDGWMIKVKSNLGEEGRPVPHMKQVTCRGGCTVYSVSVGCKADKCLKCGGLMDQEVVVAPHVHPTPFYYPEVMFN